MLAKWTADSIWLYFQFPAKGTTNSWPYFMINVFVSECLGVSILVEKLSIRLCLPVPVEEKGDSLNPEEGPKTLILFI